MDVIYRSGEATAAEVMDGMPDPPSYSAVRAMLRILEEKGHLTHTKDGPRYVYQPTVAPDKARQHRTPPRRPHVLRRLRRAGRCRVARSWT